MTDKDRESETEPCSLLSIKTLDLIPDMPDLTAGMKRAPNVALMQAMFLNFQCTSRAQSVERVTECQKVHEDLDSGPGETYMRDTGESPVKCWFISGICYGFDIEIVFRAQEHLEQLDGIQNLELGLELDCLAVLIPSGLGAPSSRGTNHVPKGLHERVHLRPARSSSGRCVPLFNSPSR